jgi:predicted transcriptional regulator of viral defense system
LAKEGLIAKVRRGLWALPAHADFSPYAIIPQLLRATKGEKADVRGYVSLLSALNLHGMIDQAPHVIQIVAERIRPTVRTPFGTYQFHQLDPARPAAATFPRAELAGELLSSRITRVDRKDRR